MANLFNSIKLTKPKNNVFDLTHDLKFSANMGNLIPICCLETVPGDKFNIGCESLIRFAPLVSPVMHRFNATMHYFFVPNRLLWAGWEKYITNEEGLAFPTIDVGDGYYHPLMDYLGIPNPVGEEIERISALPFAAYQMIYNEYYRDQNLIDEIDFKLVNGSNNFNTQLVELRRRAWEHDYYTSALPFAQKGEAVNLPLGEVTLKDQWYAFDDDMPEFRNPTDTNPTGNLSQTNVSGDRRIDVGGNSPMAYDPKGSLEVQNTTINDLRRAFRLQEWLEKNARGGSRYIENILAHFGVKSSDKRLQRPEYITGIKTPIVISEVLNTTGTEELPQGNMAGKAVGVTTGKYGKYFCEEHGYIMGIMSVMPKTAYQQGIPKHFIKTNDPFQFYWPSFAHIGEQEVQNREVYAYQGEETGADTFGYVPRYAEYKFEQNRVAGEFRSTLNHWHAGRIFENAPQLNEQFISADPTHRIFAVTAEEEQKLYCHVLNRIKAVRPMPKFGTPMF